MDTNKLRAQRLAVDWWKSDQAARARAEGCAICDSCGNERIDVGKGYLCIPAIVGMSGLPAAPFASPDLVCESCFDGKSYEPYNAKQTEHITAKAQAALEAFEKMSPDFAGHPQIRLDAQQDKVERSRAVIRCQACKKMRPVEENTCPHCGAQ